MSNSSKQKDSVKTKTVLAEEGKQSFSRRDAVVALLGAAGVTSLAGCEGLSEEDLRTNSSLKALVADDPMAFSDILVFPSMNGQSGMEGTRPGIPDVDSVPAILAGYHTPGDGGGGIFYYDQNNDGGWSVNGGTIVDGGTYGVWVRIYDGPINVKWFGAKGDGTDADLTTEAIQAAINSGSSTLVIPSGTYLVDKLQVLKTNVSVGFTIQGEGISNTTLLSSESGDDSFVTDGISYFTLRDLTIDGNEIATSVSFNAMYSKIENVEIKNHINYQLDWWGLVSEINSCVFSNTADLTLDPDPDLEPAALFVRFNSLHINNSQFNTQQKVPAILVGEYSQNNCNEVTITGCTIENSSYGIKVKDGINTSALVFNNNYFELVDAANAIGIYFNGGLHRAVTIANNHITETKQAIELFKVNSRSNFTITNNYLYKPIIIVTPTYDTNKLYAWELPALEIDHQHVEKDHAEEDYTFDFTPVVIVDQNFGFLSLYNQKMKNVLDYAYNKLTGRIYAQTAGNTATDVLRWSIPDSGGTVYPFVTSGELGVVWRQYTSSVTGKPSAHSERHDIKFVARNTGRATIADNVTSLSTTTGITSAQMTIIGPTDDVTKNSFALEVTGQSGLSINEWLVDFDIEYGR